MDAWQIVGSIVTWIVVGAITTGFYVRKFGRPYDESDLIFPVFLWPIFLIALGCAYAVDGVNWIIDEIDD